MLCVEISRTLLFGQPERCRLRRARMPKFSIWLVVQHTLSNYVSRMSNTPSGGWHMSNGCWRMFRRTRATRRRVRLCERSLASISCAAMARRQFRVWFWNDCTLICFANRAASGFWKSPTRSSTISSQCTVSHSCTATSSPRI